MAKNFAKITVLLLEALRILQCRFIAKVPTFLNINLYEDLLLEQCGSTPTLKSVAVLDSDIALTKVTLRNYFQSY